MHCAFLGPWRSLVRTERSMQFFFPSTHSEHPRTSAIPSLHVESYDPPATMWDQSPTPILTGEYHWKPSDTSTTPCGPGYRRRSSLNLGRITLRMTPLFYVSFERFVRFVFRSIYPDLSKKSPTTVPCLGHCTFNKNRVFFRFVQQYTHLQRLRSEQFTLLSVPLRFVIPSIRSPDDRSRSARTMRCWNLAGAIAAVCTVSLTRTTSACSDSAG